MFLGILRVWYITNAFFEDISFGFLRHNHPGAKFMISPKYDIVPSSREPDTRGGGFKTFSPWKFIKNIFILQQWRYVTIYSLYDQGI